VLARWVLHLEQPGVGQAIVAGFLVVSWAGFAAGCWARGPIGTSNKQLGKNGLFHCLKSVTTVVLVDAVVIILISASLTSRCTAFALISSLPRPLSFFEVQFAKAIAETDSIRALGNSSIHCNCSKLGPVKRFGNSRYLGKGLATGHDPDRALLLPDVLRHRERAARNMR